MIANAEKRSVSTDALETLGTIIGEGAGRDAIHLAVEPVEAGERLVPGQKIGLVDGRAFNRGVDKHLGIVDPFLTASVAPGERFWLVVFPRQITSLRHVWTHPDFPEAKTAAPAAPTSNSKSASEVWMRKWAMKHVSDDYYGEGGSKSEDEALRYAVEAGEDTNLGPYESARDYIDDEWWTHWEIITGKRGKRGAWFSCAC